MPKAVHPDVKNLAQSLYFQGFKPMAIADKLKGKGVTANAVRMWVSRNKWKVTMAETRAVTVQNEPQAVDMVSQSKRVREALGAELEAQLKVVTAAPMTFSDLPGRDGRANLARTIADTAKTVYGWDADSGKSLVQVNILATGPNGVEWEKEAKQV